MPDNRDTEYFASLALRNTPGLGPKTQRKLLAHYGRAYPALRDAANWPRLKLANRRQAEASKAESWRLAAEDEYHRARRRNMAWLLYSDDDYPQRLKHLDDPPLILYHQGNLDLLRSPGVAVVGARRCNGRGDAIARDISADLSRIGLTIISGLAMGVDRQAHLGGLAHIGGSVAVLGCGLDVTYPKANADVWEALAEQGLIISEYGPGVRPESKHFPYRNRLISGLAMGVLVAQAAKRSGSLITARLALEQGKDVFALPGSAADPDFEGCNELIKAGATLVRNAEDIVWELKDRLCETLGYYPDPALVSQKNKKNHEGPDQAPNPAAAPPAPLPELDGPQKTAMEALLSAARLHIDELVRRLEWDSAQVSAVLLDLEMQGLVRQSPGMYYEPIKGGRR
ncbi:MAG: processing protein [Desulfovibrionales bacterium]|jgi:DNA processing protein|nr:processing protein [Desulfovibrionales bacterium]